MAKATAKNQNPGFRKGRPTREEAKKRDDQLKRAAYRLFLEKGFDAVTMEAIAVAAGITKRTLYYKYSDKSQLFSVVLRDMKFAWPTDEMDLLANKQLTLIKKLSLAADTLMEQVLNPETIKMARMATAKADEFADDIQQGFSMSRDPRLHSIVKILDKHETELNERFRKEKEKAAELFIGMVIGMPGRLAGFGTLRAPEFEAARIALAVELFIAGICK